MSLRRCRCGTWGRQHRWTKATHSTTSVLLCQRGRQVFSRSPVLSRHSTYPLGNIPPPPHGVNRPASPGCGPPGAIRAGGISTLRCRLASRNGQHVEPCRHRVPERHPRSRDCDCGRYPQRRCCPDPAVGDDHSVLPPPRPRGHLRPAPGEMRATRPRTYIPSAVVVVPAHYRAAPRVISLDRAEVLRTNRAETDDIYVIGFCR